MGLRKAKDERKKCVTHDSQQHRSIRPYSKGMSIEALEPEFLEKVWGARNLSPWFPDSGVKIGEVWLNGPRGERLPLLVKFLFTTERLSVQVHPNDEYAALHHQSKGKTEMWHILRAEPGAQIALGLKHGLGSGRELREASESGAILDLLNWIDVTPGENYFVPAGTIHAIGAGLALCEIQQYSDVTYRLFDYGRPRELHLDRGVEVSDLRKYAAVPQPPEALVDCGYFRTELIEVKGTQRIAFGSGLLIAIGGNGTIDDKSFQMGEAWKVFAAPSLEISASGTAAVRFLKTFVP